MSNTSDDSNFGPVGMIGGAIAAIVLGAVLVKAFTKFLNDLSIFFEALALSISKFVGLSFSVIQLGLLYVVSAAAIYFLIVVVTRYRKIIREATDVRNEMDNYRKELQSIVESRTSQAESYVRGQVYLMHEHVKEALKPPEAAPPPLPAAPSNVSDETSIEELSDEEKISENQNEESPIFSATNPY